MNQLHGKVIDHIIQYILAMVFKIEIVHRIVNFCLKLI